MNDYSTIGITLPITLRYLFFNYVYKYQLPIHDNL